ncbi:Sushi domain-containing protein [Plasmodiophora brassicae]|nr:hypothetical protein PBRA_001488 [Plasmodiophora brassicae]
MSAIVHVAVSTAVQTGACEPGHYQCGVTGNGTRPDTIYACTAWGEWVPQEDCASAPGGPHVCRVLSDNVPHCVPPGKGCKPGQYRCGESPANNASTIYACDAFGNWVFGYDCPPPSSCRVLADRQPHCV